MQQEHPQLARKPFKSSHVGWTGPSIHTACSGSRLTPQTALTVIWPTLDSGFGSCFTPQTALTVVWPTLIKGFSLDAHLLQGLEQEQVLPAPRAQRGRL